MASTSTKKLSIIRRVNNTRLMRAAAAILDHEAGEAVMQKTFLAWCAMPISDDTIAVIANALYYLPQNFMIMLPRTVALGAVLTSVINGSMIKNQIKFYDDEDSSKKDESFSLADAVISAETETSIAIIPASRYSELAAKDFSFAVGRSPEAIASALLKLARDEA
jgi:hypothetical protein